LYPPIAVLQESNRSKIMQKSIIDILGAFPSYPVASLLHLLNSLREEHPLVTGISSRFKQADDIIASAASHCQDALSMAEGSPDEAERYCSRNHLADLLNSAKTTLRMGVEAATRIAKAAADAQAAPELLRFKGPVLLKTAADKTASASVPQHQSSKKPERKVRRERMDDDHARLYSLLNELKFSADEETRAKFQKNCYVCAYLDKPKAEDKHSFSTCPHKPQAVAKMHALAALGKPAKFRHAAADRD
jgi:hypothetical protein